MGSVHFASSSDGSDREESDHEAIEQVASTENGNSEDRDSDDRDSDDKDSEDRDSDDRDSEDRDSDDRDSEDRDSEHSDSEDSDEVIVAVLSFESYMADDNLMTVDSDKEANPDTGELKTVSNSSQRSAKHGDGATEVLSSRSIENDAENDSNGTAEPVKKHETGSFRRLMKELNDITENPPPFCTAGIRDNNLYAWKAIIIGPPDTVYEGGVFTLHIDFSANYPFRAPIVKFQTRVYHCNIDSKGNICLDILSTNWSPAITVSTLLLSICSLLSNCNPNDPLVHGIAELYRTNREEHDRRARRYTIRYAT